MMLNYMSGEVGGKGWLDKGKGKGFNPGFSPNLKGSKGDGKGFTGGGKGACFNCNQMDTLRGIIYNHK